MICGNCQTVIENVQLQASNGVGRIGPASFHEDLRNVIHIRQASAVHCCICRRVEDVVQCSLGDRAPESIWLKYRATDLQGFFQVDVTAYANPHKADLGRRDNAGETLYFALLPELPECHAKVQSFDRTPGTTIETARRYVRWRMEVCSRDHSECRRGNWWRPEVRNPWV